MEVITPSYAPDFELCRDLNQSVLDNTSDDVTHKIFVSRRDLEQFALLTSDRTEIVCTADLLPRTLVELPRLNFSVNLRQPFPPIRGWMRQQLVKLAAAAASSADVVIVVDSDIEFIRPFTAETFRQHGVVRLYRWPEAIDDGMSRHIAWHNGARYLLGLQRVGMPFTDYISSPLAWDPALVRQLLARVEAIAKHGWTTELGGLLHLSEATLYGLFVDECLGPPANTFSSEDSYMHGYWETTPIHAASAAAFIAGISPTDLAVMISAKSGTPLAVRRQVIAELRRALPANDRPTRLKPSAGEITDYR